MNWADSNILLIAGTSLEDNQQPSRCESTEGSTTSLNEGIGTKLTCSEKQDTRVCASCGVEKPLTDEFFYAKKAQNGNRYYRRKCKECHNDSLRASKLVRQYGLDARTFEEMMERQQNRCFICERKFNHRRYDSKPHVDHDHETGRVRGILCMRCNTGLGMFQDKPYLLKRAQEYLCEDIV